MNGKFMAMGTFVVLATSIGCAKPGGGVDVEARSAKDRPVFVHLYMKDGTCTPIAGEEAVPVGLGDRVVWEIYNSCTDRDEYEVNMEGFKEKGTNKPNNPLKGNGPYKRKVRKFETDYLKVNIKDQPDKLRYKYDIKLSENNARQDPELEVEY